MRTSTPSSRQLIVSALALTVSACGFFHDDENEVHPHPEEEDSRGHGRGGRGYGGGPADPTGPVCEDASVWVDPWLDAGLFDAGPSVPDAGATVPDAGAIVPDAGATRPDSGLAACSRSYDCPADQQCVGSVCTACAGASCACRRDDDCSASQLCDRPTGVCTTPLAACGTLSTEPDCSARADCQPVYAGTDCRDRAGGVCQDGDTECTCARFSFAACLARP